MKYTCGTDFGSSGTKTVCLEMSWGRMSKAEAKNKMPVTGILPAQSMTYRTMPLPFQDKRKCFEIVKEEISYSLAFPVENALWDFFISPSGNGFAAIVQKEKAAPFLEKADLLDCEVCALMRTALYCNCQNTLILNFGAEKTLLIYIHGGSLEYTKMVMHGGNQITRALALSEKISWDEAEKLKKETEFTSRELKDFFGDLTSHLDLPVDRPWKNIVLCGGGAKLPGLKEEIEKQAKKPVELFQLPDGLDPYGEAVAFGGAIRDKYGHLAVNFRETKTDNLEIPIWWAIAIAVPILLYPIHLHLESANLQKQIGVYSTAMSENLRKEFPDITRAVRPLEQLQERILQKKRGTAGGGRNMLELLEPISRSVTDKSVNIYEIDLSDQTITVRGEAPSYQAVEDIRKELSGDFQQVKLLEGKTLPSSRITFTLNLKGRAESTGENT